MRSLGYFVVVYAVFKWCCIIVSGLSLFVLHIFPWLMMTVLHLLKSAMHISRTYNTSYVVFGKRKRGG